MSKSIVYLKVLLQDQLRFLKKLTDQISSSEFDDTNTDRQILSLVNEISKREKEKKEIQSELRPVFEKPARLSEKIAISECEVLIKKIKEMGKKIQKISESLNEAEKTKSSQAKYLDNKSFTKLIN